MRFRIVVDGETHEVDVDRVAEALVVRVDGALYRTRVVAGHERTEVRIGSNRHDIRFHGTSAVVDGHPHEIVSEAFEDITAEISPGHPGLHKGTLELRPPMPGRVVRVAVTPGAVVKRGQTLVVLEAMKMQNEIPAPADVIVREVRVREGESIAADRIIAVLETT